MQRRNKAPRGRAALDPRVLPAFEARAKALGPGRPKAPHEPPELTQDEEAALKAASEGLPPDQAALLRALALSRAAHPHPSGRCEYLAAELAEWSGLGPKGVASAFPALCAAGLCELSAIGSRDPKPCARLPWLPPEGGEGDAR